MKRNYQRGFTLIEIMVVIIILGLLAGLVLPKFLGQEEKAKREVAKTQIRSLEGALDAYRLDNGFYRNLCQIHVRMSSLVDALKAAVGKWAQTCPFCGSSDVRRVYAVCGGPVLLEVDYVCKGCSKSFGVNRGGNPIEKGSAVREWNSNFIRSSTTEKRT